MSTNAKKVQRGSIEKRGNAWFLRFTHAIAQGEDRPPVQKRLRIELGSTSKIRSEKAARNAADTYLALLYRPTLKAGERVLAVKYLEHYLASTAVLMRTTSQARFRSVARKHLIPQFAGLKLDEIDKRQIQNLIAHLATQQLERDTVRGIRNVLLQILNTAHRDGYAVHLVPRSELVLPKTQSAPKEVRHVGPDELAALLRGSDFPWRALWAVMGFAGLRIGEALGLTWRHIDFERRALTIRQSAVNGQLAPTKTVTSHADVPMVEPLQALLREYQTVWRANEQGLLFATAHGTPHDSRYVRRAALLPLIKRLGLQHAGFHALRHGLPARLNAAGVSPGVIQKIMRHSSLAMTERYLHISVADVRAALDAAYARQQNPTGAAQYDPSNPVDAVANGTSQQAITSQKFNAQQGKQEIQP